jgi:uncharacterized protein DUF3362
MATVTGRSQLVWSAGRSVFDAAPRDIATCMWYTGIDPMTGRPVQVARHLRDRKLQRSLMQFFKPENWFQVHEALVEAGRTDLIGTGCDALIPPKPPKQAIEGRQKRANAAVRNDHYHSVANPAAGEEPGERPAPPRVGNRGYRPGRKTQARRADGKRKGRPHAPRT